MMIVYSNMAAFDFSRASICIGGHDNSIIVRKSPEIIRIDNDRAEKIPSQEIEIAACKTSENLLQLVLHMCDRYLDHKSQGDVYPVGFDIDEELQRLRNEQ